MMEGTFPVSQSVLDADALAAELKQRYALCGDVRCLLLSRGMNDIYRVEHADGPHALKVARTGKSSDDEFAYEQAYVHHLGARGIAVPSPVPLNNGDLFFSVNAPEGKRQIVLMDWLEGEPFTHTVDERSAHRLGAFLADIHIAAQDFKTDHRKAVASETKLPQRLPELTAMFDGRAEDQAFLGRAGDAALSFMASLDQDEVPFGACHGDLQCANAMELKEGGLAVFDFSDCGTDPLAKDISAFYWRNDFEGRPESINQAFVDGYDSRRPLTSAEKGAQPMFRLMRHLLITSSMALFINRIGPVPGFDENIDYYLEMIRRYAADAGVA